MRELVRPDKWTESAIDCYNRGCRCAGCLVYEQIGKECRMKKAVLRLVRKWGRPPEKVYKLFEGTTKSEDDVIDAILNGAKTKKEIVEMTGRSRNSVQGFIDRLCRIAMTNGCLFTKRLNRLPELVEFIKERYNDTRDEQA